MAESLIGFPAEPLRDSARMEPGLESSQNIDWHRFLRELPLSAFHGTLILELQGGKEIPVLLAEARKARSYLRMISRRFQE